MSAIPDGMAPIKTPANLPELVRSTFNRARASGDVHFFPTQVTLVNVNSIPFQLRFSPALASKPRAPQPPPPSTDASLQTQSSTEKKPFFDPFDNPPAAMLITQLPPSHNLVLNKFAIVPEHFILATQAFKEQTHLLEKADLEAAYACIEAYHQYHTRAPDNDTKIAASGVVNDGNGSGELFVFFNSGAASGSSQPHRHIQMLPVDWMREGLSGEEEAAWAVLAGGLMDDSVRGRVPFQTFAEKIGKGVDLSGVYGRLYRRACEAVLGTEGPEVDGQTGEEREARVDYNLAMTRNIMVIAPRVTEGEAVTAVGDDGERKVLGKLALNGTVLAGTALVKSQAEWDALRAEPEQLLEILGRIGVPTIRAPSARFGVGADV
ncbi:hypothetical protein N657DRAFT_690720 [Parathielavia appendiculata]|uniref:Uncharacterized protein n=1 Tax=Parathielavia appendiculata TaxID=2587402 RepID=A0AAN6TYT6_9PEZI|nr:hypothetical protein N657DRAFT_690720 [Parathielavia appendiculata]